MATKEICGICFEELSDTGNIITKCGHRFCIDCYNELILKHNFKNNLVCPNCRSLVAFKKTKEQLLCIDAENLDDNEIERLEPVIGFLFQLLRENIS